MRALAAVDNREAVAAADANPAVCPDRLDHRERPDGRDVPANREHPVCPATQESRQHSHASQSHRHHANRAQPVHPDLLAHQDHPVTLVSPVNPDSLDKTHHPANQDQRDRLGHLDHLDSQEHPASPAHLLNRNQSCPDHPESLAMPDHPDNLDSPVSLARTVRPDSPDQRDHLAHLDHPETMANLDNRARPVNPEAKARRAFARNIVPSTVVCSSRTAPDVVKRGSSTMRMAAAEAAA